MVIREEGCKSPTTAITVIADARTICHCLYADEKAFSRMKHQSGDLPYCSHEHYFWHGR